MNDPCLVIWNMREKPRRFIADISLASDIDIAGFGAHPGGHQTRGSVQAENRRASTSGCSTPASWPPTRTRGCS